MIQILLRPLVKSVGIVWMAATLGFLALSVLPGDAIASQLSQSGADPELIEAYRDRSGLNAPLSERYVRFFVGLVRGDMGVSLLSGEPVSDAIVRSLLPTATLALSAMLFGSAVGLLLGMADGLDVPLFAVPSSVLISLALSVPIYWSGTLAIYVFTAQLGLLPSAGAGRLSQLVLPVLVLGFHMAGGIARVMRISVREILDADYVRTARAKGLHERRVLLVHVLRVALLPVISVIALQAGFLFSGAVITESLFVRPGIGRLLLDAVIQQDYPIVMGVIVFSASVYAALSLLSDFVLRLLDPRVAL